MATKDAASRKRLLPPPRLTGETETTRQLTALLDGKKPKKRKVQRKPPKNAASSTTSTNRWSHLSSSSSRSNQSSKRGGEALGMQSLSSAPSFVQKKLQKNSSVSTAPKQPTKAVVSSRKPPPKKKENAATAAQKNEIIENRMSTFAVGLLKPPTKRPRITNRYSQPLVLRKPSEESSATTSEKKSTTPFKQMQNGNSLEFKDNSSSLDESFTKESTTEAAVLPPLSSAMGKKDGEDKPAGTISVSDIQPKKQIKPLQPFSALAPIPLPKKEDTKEPSSKAISAKPKPAPGNFVRLNLRNSAGACRGARNKKTKKKATILRETKRAERPRSNEAARGNDIVVSQNGIDPLDDYLDGVFTRTTQKSKNKNRQAIPQCSGHQRPCKLLTVKKTSTGNKGRQFYCCSLPRGEQCNHFQWADDTVEAAQAALLKNKSHSGFIARQVASYMESVKCLTVPELKDMAKRHQLNAAGKKQQLLTRISIWVRDEVASATSSNLEKDNEETGVEETNANDMEDSLGSDDSSTSSEELEFFGGGTKKKKQSLGSNKTEPLTDSEADSENEETKNARIQRPKPSLEENCLGEDSDDDSEVSDEDSGDDNRESTKHESTSCPLRSSLRTYFGHTQFREGQEWAIRRCLNKERTLLVAPTGFGKSLCYALPSTLMDGVCIVVSPLLSLIQDQLRVLPPRIPAATLSGPLSSAKMAATLDDIVRGRIKVLFVSPERLTSSSFRRMFRVRWNPETRTQERQFPAVSLLCVDEAHCLSQWAHNFRPSYLRMKSMLEMIQPGSVLAITATAGPRVVDDICRTLSITNDHGHTMPQCDSGVRTMKSNRDNIDVSCSILSSQEERLRKLINLLLPAKAKSKKSKGVGPEDANQGCLSIGSVIVYVWRQRDAEAVAENIQAAGVEGGIVIYHGGMDSGARSKAQSKFMRGKARICVATVAFGLGINKADVTGVIHMYLSASPEHYLQEIGRAGRDGRPARAVALVLAEEVLVRHSLVHSDLIAVSQVQSLLTALSDQIQQSLSVLPDNRSKLEPLNVALPVQKFVHRCDCKAETIETLVSLLEQRTNKAPLIHIEGIVYDRAFIAPKRRLLKDLAKKEKIAQAILQAAVCVDPPAGEKIVAQDRADVGGERKLVGYSFGSYSMSVAECANCLGSGAEPRHVFAALRRLQSTGEIELVLETSATGRALNTRITKEGMAVFQQKNQEVIDELATEIIDRFASTIALSASKVLDINFILHRVQAASEFELEHGSSKAETCMSASLRTFQNLIQQYFEAEGDGRTLVSAPTDLPDFNDCFSVNELSNDASSVVSHLLEIQAASQGKALLQLNDPRLSDYTALIITKFLHGIAPVCAPVSLCRQHPLFGRMQGTRFCDLYDAVCSLLKVSNEKLHSHA